MKGTRVTPFMGFHPTSQDQSTSTPCSQERPPSTQLTTQPRTSSCPLPPDVPEACHSEKGSAGQLTFDETPHWHSQQTPKVKKTSQWQNWMTLYGMRSWYQTAGNTSASMRFLGQPCHPIPTAIPATPPLQPDQGLPDTPPQKPNQVEVPKNQNWWNWMYQMISLTC